MASPGLHVFDDFVDGHTTPNKAALKARGERLYLDVYRELPSLLGVLGDADVAAQPGDTKLAERQTSFKAQYTTLEAEKAMLHPGLNDWLDAKVEVE